MAMPAIVDKIVAPFRSQSKRPWQPLVDHYTPDIMRLQQSEWQLLFAFDELKQGRSKHDIIDHYSMPIGTAYTQGLYKVWYENADVGTLRYPIAMEHPPHVEKNFLALPNLAKIKGELYAVRPYQYLELDKYKQNGVKFNRRRVRLVFPYFQKLKRLSDNIEFNTMPQVYIITAWMYIGIREYWEPLIKEAPQFKFSTAETVIDPFSNYRWKKQYYNL